MSRFGNRTGKIATAEDANEVGAIRAVIAEVCCEEMHGNCIQYGGSVIQVILKNFLREHIDGALVGGASLQADSFLKLIEAGANE